MNYILLNRIKHLDSFALFVCSSISAKPRADGLQLQFTSIQKSKQRDSPLLHNSRMELNVCNEACFQGSGSIQSPPSYFREYDCTIPKAVQMSGMIDNQRVKSVPLLVQSRQSDSTNTCLL